MHKTKKHFKQKEANNNQNSAKNWISQALTHLMLYGFEFDSKRCYEHNMLISILDTQQHIHSIPLFLFLFLFLFFFFFFFISIGKLFTADLANTFGIYIMFAIYNL